MPCSFPSQGAREGYQCGNADWGQGSGHTEVLKHKGAHRCDD